MSTISAAVTPTERSRSGGHSDVFDEIWRLFTSPRLALFLMLGIAAAGVAGALIPRAPVFQSVWFRALLGLLAVNIVICTINRLPGIWQAVMHPVARPGEALFERGQPRQTVLVSSVDGLRAALHGLRSIETREPTGLYVYADQNQLARFGTLISHAALVLVLLATVLSGPLGYFEESAFAVPVGSTRDIGHNTGLSVKLEDFSDEYYAETGQPKDYRSDLVVMQNGREVAHQTVRVNEPLIYGDVRFHQSAFGNAAAVTISQPGNGVLFQDAVPFTWRANDGQRPVGYVYLPTRDLHVYLVGTAGSDDPVIQPGQMAVEAYQGSATTPTYRATLTQHQPQSIGDLKVVFDRELQFTSLRVVRDPSASLIWVASVLMILGFCLAFYFPHRRLWARARSVSGGVEVTLVGAGNDTAGLIARTAQRLRDSHGR